MKTRYYPQLQQGSDEWLAARKLCVTTTSEFAAALGVSSFMSRAALIRAKLEQDSTEFKRPNMYMQLGNAYEGPIADAYAKALAINIGTYGMVVCDLGDGLVLGCSPDRVVYDETLSSIEGLIEVKYSHASDMSVPIDHLCQMLGQAKLFNLPYVDYVKWGPKEVTPEGNMIINATRCVFSDRLWREAVAALRAFKQAVDRKMPTNPDPVRKRRLRAAIFKGTKFLPIEL